jgi:stage V sporulation protein S
MAGNVSMELGKMAPVTLNYLDHVVSGDSVEPPWPKDETGSPLPDIPNELVRVKNSSSVPGLGSLIYYQIRLYGKSSLRAIGAGAVNQAIKGTVKARQLYSVHGEDMVVKPGMITVPNDGGDGVAAVVLHCVLS